MKLRVKALLAGLATYVPGYNFRHGTGGTDSARYCYAVWLRHLILAHAAKAGGGMPAAVAELGPGDSIGIGLAALLSGAEKYYALDVVPYPDLRSNLEIFDELVALFQRREPIPGDDEFPSVSPKLGDYAFPHHLLSEAWLTAALEPARVADIRASIEQPESDRSRIFYRAPWTKSSVLQPQSTDMIYSQAVLEHVDDLAGVYGAMRRWLKPTGIMSHQIDYRCHGKADTWNGHWTYSNAFWKVVVGRRAYLLNRVPHSEHIRLLREAGFVILSASPERAPSVLNQRQLAAPFRGLSRDDLTTCGAFILAAVPESTGGSA
jgi:hypothetical protein